MRDPLLTGTIAVEAGELASIGLSVFGSMRSIDRPAGGGFLGTGWRIIGDLAYREMRSVATGMGGGIKLRGAATLVTG